MSSHLYCPDYEIKNRHPQFLDVESNAAADRHLTTKGGGGSMALFEDLRQFDEGVRG